MSNNTSLKRKVIYEEEDHSDPPRKVAAVGTNGASKPNRPLQPSRTATNLRTASTNVPKPLTKPRAPVLSTSRSTSVRGTSAPPQSSAAVSRVTSRPTTSSRAGAIPRTVSGPLRTLAGVPEDKRFNEIQTQLSSLESARAADAARLAADMEAERAKVSELQQNHLALSRELATAKDQELNQRRELSNASDEIANIKKMHSMEVMDLEMSLKKRDREIREVNEDLRMCREDLERERTTVSSLKSTIAHQSNAHLTLTTENHSLQAQNAALQSSIDVTSRNVSDLRFQLEAAERKVAEMKEEAMESESVRRKLHNMVQELKGNIRVFCRVRPVLPSDAPLDASTNSSASGSTSTPPAGPEEVQRLRDELQANMLFPDQRDHKEIVLNSSSESATGQERKETHSFGFDRVCPLHSYIHWL